MENDLALTVPRRPAAPLGDAWRDVPAIPVDRFHPRSSEHRPRVVARLAHTGRTLHLRFDVEDRYVVVRHTEPQGPVCRDSCVEFFVEPRPGRGYFNFEVNAGGTLHLWHIGAPEGKRPVDHEAFAAVRIETSLPPRVEPELTEPTSWWATIDIPLRVFERSLGPLPDLGGETWRGNFFKCADDSSHPHWASWAPIGERLNFHQPDRFAPLRFEG